MELPNEVLNQIVPFSGLPDKSAPGTMLQHGQPLQQTKTAYTTAVTVQKPRQISTIASNVLQESKLAGTHFFYRWEVFDKTKNRKVPIIGPSIDLAMCIARNYGNCVLDVEATETPTHYMMKGVFIDLETGFTCPRLFRQRKKQSISGKMDADRQEDIVFQIGQSKAIRNAVVKAMPAWLIDKAIETAMQAEVAGIKPENIAFARSKVIDFFSQYGVTADEISVERGRQPDQWTSQDIVDLRAMATAIKEGRVSAQEIFTKPEEPTDGPNNGNPKKSDGADPSTPGSGGSVRESETEKEPAQTGQDPGPEQKTVKEPSVEEARKWCADNDIMGAYRSDKQNFVDIAAKSFNINVTSMPWREAHQYVKDAMQPSKNEDPTEEEDGNGSNQSLIDLYDYFNEANVNCRNISGGVELFRQATKEAGMGTGQRPQGIEQATKFKEVYEKLLANHTVSSEMSMKKDREIDEPDMDAIMDSLQEFCNDKGLQFEMFKKFLNERSSKAGVPISALIENMLGNEDNAGNMIEAFRIWKKSEQF